MTETHGDVLVFSDANSMFEPRALRELAGPFADPGVGGVAGDQCYVEDLRGSEGECCYWDFDRRLKRWESTAGHVTSATGAIHAVRRELFHPVPSGVTDDFMLSTGVIAQGYRLVFNEAARALEQPGQVAAAEFGRKVRVITRGLRGVLARRHLLNPRRYGFYALQLFSHKVLRRLIVFPLLVLLVLSIRLWPAGWPYCVAAVGQLMFYGLAALAVAMGHTRFQLPKLFSLPFYFCLVNAAALVATVNVVMGRRIELWQPDRPGRHSAGEGATPEKTTFETTTGRRGIGT